MRQKIVAGNWKMNNDAKESAILVSDILKLVSHKPFENGLIILFPSFTNLHQVSSLVESEQGRILTGGQNCHWEEKGAFTGEVSASMLKSCGAGYVLIGHSERRQYFNESNDLLAKKIKIALENGLTPVYCCGELLAHRKSNQHFEVVQKQIEEGLLFFTGQAGMEKLIIAYEPVWAIGTGETASPLQAQEMHEFIRKLLEHKYGKEISSATSVLYGGSCNASNAHALFAQPDIDGGLIGGASLKASEFVAIISSF